MRLKLGLLLLRKARDCNKKGKSGNLDTKERASKALDMRYDERNDFIAYERYARTMQYYSLQHSLLTCDRNGAGYHSLFLLPTPRRIAIPRVAVVQDDLLYRFVTTSSCTNADREMQRSCLVMRWEFDLGTLDIPFRHLRMEKLLGAVHTYAVRLCTLTLGES